MRKPLDCDHAPNAALALFQRFHAFAPTRCFEKNVRWPEVQGTLAYATAVAYRSDKWDYQKKDFVHEHCDPLPAVITRYKRGLTWKKNRRTFRKPRGFVVLGECLDVELQPGSFNAEALGIRVDDEGCGHIDFMGNARMPLLCADPTRRMLIVVPTEARHHPLLLWSPILAIEERGIVF